MRSQGDRLAKALSLTIPTLKVDADRGEMHMTNKDKQVINFKSHVALDLPIESPASTKL